MKLWPSSGVGWRGRTLDGAVHDFWVLVIGLCGGVIARVVTPGKKAPFGFMLTSLLGISGAFVAAYLGQEAGWFRADGVAGLIAAACGAVVALAIWAILFRSGRPTSSL